MTDINLHFTGDFHAIGIAHNLLCALIDNHIYWGNELRLDQRMIAWRRVMDMNDRSLRHIVLGLGGRYQGIPREGGFDITAASEIMAILCLANSLEDLRQRLDLRYSFDSIIGRDHQMQKIYDTISLVAPTKAKAPSGNEPGVCTIALADSGTSIVRTSRRKSP